MKTVKFFFGALALAAVLLVAVVVLVPGTRSISAGSTSEIFFVSTAKP